MSYSLLWCLPRKHLDDCRSKWNAFTKHRYHHLWIEEANDIQNLSLESISSVQCILGTNTAQQNTTLQLVQKWMKPIQSIWLVEFSQEWIPSYRNLFTHCLPLNFTLQQVRRIELKLFDNAALLSSQKLELVERNNTIRWIPWDSIQQIIFKTKEVHIIVFNQRKHIGPDFTEKVLRQLEKKEHFFPLKSNHFINLNCLREIVKLEPNEYCCLFYSDNIIRIDSHSYRELQKHLNLY